MSDLNTLKQLLDSKELQQEIRIAINQVVNQHVNTSLSQTDIDAAIDKHLSKRVKFNKDTLLAGFPSIQDSGTKPEITILPDNVVVESTLITKNIESLETAKLENLEVSGEFRFNGDSLISTGNNTKLLEHLTQSITSSIDQTIISEVIESIKSNLSDQVITKVRHEYNKTVREVVEQEIPVLMQTVDIDQKIDTLASQVINQLVDRSVRSADVPKLVKDMVTRTMTLNQSQLNKMYPGIEDQSDAVNLTLMPGVVVNEHDFVSKNIEVMNTITADSASVNNLTVLDKIDINGPAKQSLVDVIGLDIKQNLEQTWQNQIAEKVTESIAKHGVNIKDALLNNEPLVTNGVLNSSINNIGPLNALKVNGNATVGVMHIKDNRVGINTDSPDSSLSIWDEEVAISIGKKQQNTGFVGTSRSQDLSLGTNNRAQLTIRQDGTVEVDKLKLANRQIGFSETVPNWSGAKGDIMFNSNPTNESVTGWICLGTFRWKGF